MRPRPRITRKTQKEENRKTFYLPMQRKNAPEKKRKKKSVPEVEFFIFGTDHNETETIKEKAGLARSGKSQKMIVPSSTIKKLKTDE